MAEYFYVENDKDFIVVDDTYQNYHLIDKRVINGSTLQRYSAGRGGNAQQDSLGFDLVQYTFTLSNVKNPIVAYRASGSSDTYVYTVNYNETSPNNWEMRVICKRGTGPSGADGTLTLYTYGMLTSSYTPSSGAILHIFDANGRVILDSGKPSMRVVQHESFYGTWRVNDPNQPKKFPIRNYSASKTYAIIPCSLWYQWSAINYIIYNVSFSRILDSNKGEVYTNFESCGSIQVSEGESIFPSWNLEIHSFMLIDVTGL